DEAAHAAGFVVGRGGVNLLDQTGQGVADFAREDHRDRVATVLSDQAVFLAGHPPGDVQRVERPGDVFPHLGTGLGSVVRGVHAADEQRGRQGRPHGDAIFHRRTNLLVKRTGPGTTGGTLMVYHRFTRGGRGWFNFLHLLPAAGPELPVRERIPDGPAPPAA